MKRKIILNSLKCLLAMLVIITSGCEKFLDEKSNKKLAVPTTESDLQALIDNYITVNQNMPSAGEISADNYYFKDADFNAITPESNRRMHIWEKDNVFAAGGNDWRNVFSAIYICNSVLEQVSNASESGANASQFSNVKGQALFLRAFGYLDAAQIWALAYDPASSKTDLGLPLRVDTDFNKTSKRSSLEETYQQIISDLRMAIPLLPVKPLHVARASKPAAYGLMARTYLAMRDYKNAGLYADSCLQLYSTLIDYNTLTTSATYPIAKFNAEVIFERTLNTPTMMVNTRARIDPALYSSFTANDLRRTVLFRNLGDGTFGFKGGYAGGALLFGGITTNEMLLIRAESHARNGNTNNAVSDLNDLLRKRWKAGTFIPFTAASSAAALDLVLKERRKELIMRGLRWSDIKRLNKEGTNIQLSRMINGQTYNLPPDDHRYALPIPEDVIVLSGMTQNYR